MSFPEPIENLIHREVTKLAQRTARAQERACEAALQGGECGVLETWQDGFLVSAEPCLTVPYGTVWVIHE